MDKSGSVSGAQGQGCDYRKGRTWLEKGQALLCRESFLPTCNVASLAVPAESTPEEHLSLCCSFCFNL